MAPLPAKMNEDIARKWRALVQRRREYLAELYRSGRYKKYFTEQALLHQMREAAAAAQQWDALMAPKPDDAPADPTGSGSRETRAA